MHHLPNSLKGKRTTELPAAVGCWVPQERAGTCGGSSSWYCQCKNCGGVKILTKVQLKEIERRGTMTHKDCPAVKTVPGGRRIAQLDEVGWKEPDALPDRLPFTALE